MFTKHPCRRAVALAAATLLSGAAPALAASDTTQVGVTAGSLSFTTAPDVPTMPGLTLNGQAQTLNATMNAWEASDATGSGAGWNVNVLGDSGTGKSAVFKEYCTDGTATNGCDTAVSGAAGPGYVTTSPKTLSAGSLSLSSTGAGFTAVDGTTGTPPTHSCSSACTLDGGSAVVVASAATNAGMGTYQAASYSATSVALAAPTTVKAIGTGNKAYRVDLVWTLASGPS